MGKLEEESRKRRKRANIKHAMLHAIYAAGLLSVIVLAPNVLQVLRQFDGGYRRKRNLKYTVNSSLRRLYEHDLVEFKTTARGRFVRLTNKGESKLRQLNLSSPRPLPNKKWDGRWRIVIFDIHEYRRSVRDKLRNTLSNIGFLRLQNSVWIYPHDCEDLITLLKADFRIGKDMLYIIAEQVENDYWLRKHFNLKAKS